MTHGTRSGYRYHGCRCGLCREWRALLDRRRYAHNPGRKNSTLARVRRNSRQHDLRRRTREVAAAGWTSTEQLAARWAYYGNRCWMCGVLATETDHVIPLSRGGSNWPANLRPACHSCNSSKGGAYLAGICRRLGTEE